MTDPGKNIDALWAKIDTANALDDLSAILRDVNRIEADSSIAAEDAARLIRHTCQNMIDLTQTDWKKARELIDEFLLDRCTTPMVKDASQVAELEYDTLRELLVSWIENYTSPELDSLRSYVLDELCDRANSDPTKQVMWTLAKIGYRTERVVKTLFAIVEREDEIGDAALSSIASLGMPEELRARVFELVKRKVESKGLSVGLTYSLQESVRSDAIDWIERLFPTADDSIPLKMPYALLINTLMKVSLRDNDNESLQKRVWGIIRKYPLDATRSPDIAGSCNVQDPVVDYAAWVAQLPSKQDTRRYIYYERLADLVKPRHLTGWGNITRRDLLPILQSDVTRDTEISGRFVTTEFRLKQSAYEIALSTGSSSSIGWLNEAVEEETNLFVTHSMFEILASFKLETISDFVSELITQQYDARANDDTGELFSRLGAILLARSSTARRAFESLLNCGLTHEGSVLRSTADALEDVSIARINAGDRDVVQMLLATASDNNLSTGSRGVAIGAISGLASKGLLDSDQESQLIRLSRDESLDEYSRAQSVVAIGFLSNSVGVTDALVELAQSENEIGWSALGALAQLNVLESKCEEMLGQQLHIRKEGREWVLTNASEIQGWQAFILGSLYSRNAEAFGRAFGDVIVQGTGSAVYQLLQSAAAQEISTSQIVIDSIVQRIRQRFTASTVETPLFSTLAVVDPRRLVFEAWDEVWHSWLPDGRVALCDAIAHTKLEQSDAITRAVSVLSRLAYDGVFAVRRSAYRAMARVDGEAFTSTCLQWSRSESIESRRRAAEAAEHISSGDVLDELLMDDPERLVREVAQRISANRRQHAWASDYADIVMSAARSGENSEILTAYRYGRALAKIGDDWTLMELRRFLTTESLSPHASHWIRRLTKAVDKQWTEVTRKWPEPWFSWQGTVEHAKGSIVFSDGASHEASFSLWRVDQSGPSELGEWGGAVKLTSKASLKGLIDAATCEVSLVGRKVVSAIIGKRYINSAGSEDLLLIHGNGPYPNEE